MTLSPPFIFSGYAHELTDLLFAAETAAEAICAEGRCRSVLCSFS